jgi:hypothetical protein
VTDPELTTVVAAGGAAAAVRVLSEQNHALT